MWGKGEEVKEKGRLMKIRHEKVDKNCLTVPREVEEILFKKGGSPEYWLDTRGVVLFASQRKHP